MSEASAVPQRTTRYSTHTFPMGNLSFLSFDERIFDLSAVTLTGERPMSFPLRSQWSVIAVILPRQFFSSIMIRRSCVMRMTSISRSRWTLSIISKPANPCQCWLNGEALKVVRIFSFASFSAWWMPFAAQVVDFHVSDLAMAELELGIANLRDED